MICSKFSANIYLAVTTKARKPKYSETETVARCTPSVLVAPCWGPRKQGIPDLSSCLLTLKMGTATEEPSIATIVGPGWSAKPWLSSILVIRPELRKKIVGTRCFPNETGGTVRVFYPAEETNKSHKPAGWFGVSSSLGGYLGGFLRCKLGGVSSEGPAYNAIPTRKIIPKESVLFDALSLISRGGGMGIPANRAKLPCCFENLKAGCGFGSNGSGAREGANTAPMLLWSHGLTGTGEEHALFATMLAAEGIVVAVVQHSDGTSPKVKDAQGKPVYYQHADFRNYDTSLRQRQLEHRVREIRFRFLFHIKHTHPLHRVRHRCSVSCCNRHSVPSP